MPRSVLNSFVQTAKGPLLSEETLYRDVASFRGISWQLLAACDWMQCDARPRRSPVYGETLGTVNADGTVYTSKSAALARCADDLIRLARAVYGIDLTGRARPVGAGSGQRVRGLPLGRACSRPMTARPWSSRTRSRA